MSTQALLVHSISTSLKENGKKNKKWSSLLHALHAAASAPAQHETLWLLAVFMKLVPYSAQYCKSN